MPTAAGALLTAHDLTKLQFVGDPQVSPAGTQVAFVVTTTDVAADTYRSRIWLVDSAGRQSPRPLTSGNHKDTAPRWSPDGSRLAFLSTRAGKPQIFLLTLAGGEAQQLTDRQEGAGEPAWSPAGTQIAFAAKVATPETEEEPKAGWPLRIERMRFKFDERGFIDGKAALTGRQHLFVCPVPAAGDTTMPSARQLTDGDWNDAQPCWSPDGATLAFTSYREADADRVMRSDLWTVAVADAQHLRKLTTSTGSANNLAWSPDGQQLAFLGTSDADRPYPTQRLWTVPADGSAPPQALALDLDRDASSPPTSDQTLPAGGGRPLWVDDGAALLWLVGDRGNQHVYRVPVAGGAATPVLTGARAIVALSRGAADDSPLVFAATDGLHPAELFAATVSGEDERQLTNLNGPFLAEKTLSAPEQFTFQGNFGDEVDGWLVPPVNRREGEKYPLVLMIHGGPHVQYGNAFFHEFQFLAARGYGVLYCNPHGSSGHGAAFARALAGHWGEVDLPDQLAALDTVLARGEADPERLGVGGGSYGGFMTNWVLGHSDRFKAAVSMRSISNLLNFWGTSDMFHIASLAEFGVPWETPETYLRLSPVMYAANFCTPTLLLNQEEDHRCPIEQAEQMFVALQLRDIPTRFVRFPGESHGLSRSGTPSHRLQRLEELVTWYDRFLQPAAN